MGRTNNEVGESSTKTCKSEDSSDRPLKKARYLWQIKGKYHMKKPESEAPQLFIAGESIDKGCSATGVNCITETPSTLQGCNNRAVFQEAQRNALSEAKITQAIKMPPAGIMKPQLHICNRRLRKWQARQVAWCYFDNAINKVMEESGFVPLLQDTEDYLGNLPSAGNNAEDDSLENRAVTMAIHSHGLQRAVGTENTLPFASEMQTGLCTCSEEIDYQSLLEVTFKYSQWQNGIPRRNMEAEVCMNSNNQPIFNDGKKDVNVNKDEDTSIVLDSDVCYNSNDSEDLRDHRKPLSVDDESASILEHTNFMDKAVAVAIQKKGLSTFSNLEQL